MKLSLQFSAYLLPVILLSACSVGPDFVKPAAPAIDSYSDANDLNQFGKQRIEQKKIIAENWWYEFSSPELNTVIEYGIKHNYTLASAEQNFAQARELVNASQGQLWPQVSMNADAGRQKYGVALFGPTDFQIPPFTYYEVGPSFTYLLDVFGGTRRTIEKQQALSDYQSYTLDAAYLSLTGNMVTTALTIATLNAQLETAEDIILDDKENLRLVQHAFYLGAATKADVLSAQSQLTHDQTLLPDLYQQLILAQNTLNSLVSQAPTEWQAPSFKLKNFKLPEELPLTLPSELIHTRPDILAAEAILHAASADVGIASANLYPNIVLSGSLLQEALTPKELFHAASNAWGYLADISTPIFNGDTLRAQRRAAIHAYESAYANYQQVVVDSFIQVNGILHALKYDAQEEELQKKAVLTAKSSLKLARLSYGAGNTGVLEVLDAERLYKQARLDLVKAQGQRYQDTVQLYLALGGTSYFPEH
jgi:NodT family efflux transporter outer membrane factor (OMF) lipoprotein